MSLWSKTAINDMYTERAFRNIVFIRNFFMISKWIFLTCSSRLALTPFNSTLAGLRSSVVPGNRESVNTVLRTSFDPLSEGALL